MVRPRKKYTVHDLRQLKGKRCLTHIHVKSPQEAMAAEAAGIDLMSCSFDSPEAQARLPLLVAAVPTIAVGSQGYQMDPNNSYKLRAELAKSNSRKRAHPCKLRESSAAFWTSFVA